MTTLQNALAQAVGLAEKIGSGAYSQRDRQHLAGVCLRIAIDHGPEIEALLRDRERLDYIERTFSGMTNRERYLPVQMIWGKGANGRTLREACDKYMQRESAMQQGGGGGE